METKDLSLRSFMSKGRREERPAEQTGARGLGEAWEGAVRDLGEKGV